MNKKQLGYQIGRLLIGNADIITLSGVAKFGYDSVENFLNSNIAAGVFNGALSLYLGFHGLLLSAVRAINYSALKDIRKNRESFPLEYAEKIIIEDSEGLELLLSKTNQREKKEWGTVLNVYNDKGRAVVDKILDPKLSMALGLIKKATRSSIRLNLNSIIEERYQGFHHYHPNIGPKWLGARNFSIGLVDRCSPENWINLLTFNLPEGPEIVGFNHLHTYIPLKNSKRELAKATPRQIIEYLHT